MCCGSMRRSNREDGKRKAEEGTTSARWLRLSLLVLGLAACGTTTTSPDKIYPGSVGDRLG